MLISPPRLRDRFPLAPSLGPLASALLLTAAFLCTGCVSNKYRAASALGAQPQRMDLSLGGGPELATSLNAVIIFQGPGTWKKSAYWDEFLVSIVNSSPAVVTLESASLVDYLGVAAPAGADPWLLEKASQAQRDRYASAGLNFALNTLGYAALTYGAVGTGALAGAAVTSSWAGLTAGAVVGLAVVPVTAVIVYANNQKHKHEIEREFTRRRLALPRVLAPGAGVSGSLFFPMTAGPQSLRLAWTKAGEPGVTALPLPMLAGMHRAAPVK